MSYTHILRLSNNRIKVVGSEAFIPLYRLRRLFLNDNDLNGIDNNAFGGLDVYLRVLDLSHNRFYNVPIAIRELANLVILNLQDNEIAAVSSGLFSKMSKLKSLRMKGNKIITIHNNAFWGLGNLKHLTITMALGLCDLAHIPTHEIPNLETLVVTDSIAGGVQAAYFQGLYKLKHLSFIQCMITDMLYELDPPSIQPFMGTLESLSLAHNFLALNDATQQKIRQFSSLQVLNLNHNWLEVLDETMESMFQSLRSLKQLHLRSNKISVLDAMVLEPLHELELLDLRDNRISSLDIQSGLPLFVGHIVMSLSGNPWHCECELFWLKLMIDQQINSGCIHIDQREITSTLQCQYPDRLRGVLVKDMPSRLCKRNKEQITTTVADPGLD